MSQVKKINVMLSDRVIQECSIEYMDAYPWILKCFGLELKQHIFEGNDLFESLTAFRQELESQGIQLLCAGARPDVYPSGMSRGMGGGKKAYITRLGQPALNNDLIDIFDYTEPDKVGTIDEQWAFHERWIAALRTR